jgi:hypothetical protein
MVMTVGELHAGHCINPSLADVISERNGIRCMKPLYPELAGHDGSSPIV